jgi:hypothetical protein
LNIDPELSALKSYTAEGLGKQIAKRHPFEGATRATEKRPGQTVAEEY